jgi:ribosomal protein L40E
MRKKRKNSRRFGVHPGNPGQSEAVAPLGVRRPISSGDLEDRAEVLTHREAVKGAIGLECQADPAPDAAKCRQSRDILALEEYAARIGLINPAQK